MQSKRDIELNQAAWKAAQRIGDIHAKVIRGTYSFDTDRAASIIGKEIEAAFHAGVDAAKEAIRSEQVDCPNYCAATFINSIARRCGFVFAEGLNETAVGHSERR